MFILEVNWSNILFDETIITLTFNKFGVKFFFRLNYNLTKTKFYFYPSDSSLILIKFPWNEKAFSINYVVISFFRSIRVTLSLAGKYKSINTHSWFKMKTKKYSKIRWVKWYIIQVGNLTRTVTLFCLKNSYSVNIKPSMNQSWTIDVH